MQGHISKVWGCLALVFCTCLNHAAVVSITTAMGQGADAYVWGQQPTLNFGSSGVISSRNNPGNPARNYKDYFRFDLSSVSGYDWANATSVTLRFSSQRVLSGVAWEFYGLPDGLPGDAAGGWTESGINYNNAPGNVSDPAALGFITSAPGDENGNYLTLLGSLTGQTTGAGTVHNFSSSALLDLIKNDHNGLITIAVRRLDNQGIVQLVSKESTSGFLIPTLVIDAPLSVIPEPAEYALLGVLFLGGCYLWQRRRSPAIAPPANR
ncbi:MAG: DNRLRE domain-containing protein [Verrucomicrobiae bacterium]|nr:DNRLRE domain-containing protein [Verrucomicrobiae bacterium]